MAVLLSAICLIGVVITGAQNPSQEIAFSAGLTHHQMVPANGTVVYDRIMTNIGNAYDTTTGLFTCPIGGMYVFQYHALARQNNALYLELYQNDQYINSAYGHTVNDFADAGNSVILTLQKGDTVSIRAADPSNLYGDGLEVYTTFSGFLISAS